MHRFSLFVVVVLCLPKVVIAQTKESVVPAGTLLQCTLDEPRFSSETAQVGDPVVCHVSSLGMFGRPITSHAQGRNTHSAAAPGERVRPDGGCRHLNCGTLQAGALKSEFRREFKHGKGFFPETPLRRHKHACRGSRKLV